MNSFRCIAGFSLLVVATSTFANDVDPFGFEKEHFITSKSRAEVVADIQAAQAAGQMPVFGEIGVRFVDAPSVKLREQVVAETLEARHLGLITYGELPQKEPTPEQARQIELAGLQALQPLTAQRRTTATTSAEH
jgi:hypothetical protein